MYLFCCRICSVCSCSIQKQKAYINKCAGCCKYTDHDADCHYDKSHIAGIFVSASFGCRLFSSLIQILCYCSLFPRAGMFCSLCAFLFIFSCIVFLIWHNCVHKSCEIYILSKIILFYMLYFLRKLCQCGSCLFF